MKESAILTQIINEVEAAVSSDVDVRTVGGDQDSSIPEVIIQWNPTRINGNGHNSVGGYVTNNSGEKIGIEHHTYWQMRIECTAKHYDEVDNEDIIDTIHSVFIPYEKDATKFNKDTREWDVGTGEQRQNAILEPDWYEAGITITFEYMKRVEETGLDPLKDIQKDIEVNQTLEGTSSQTN